LTFKGLMLRCATASAIALVVGGCSREAASPRAVSDGKELAIAYTSIPIESNPDTKIHVMKPDGSDDHVLTRLEKYASYAAFSPDGHKMAFVAGTPSQLFVMDSDGANVRQLTKSSKHVHFVAFSPDGKRIACIDRDHKDQEAQRTNALYVIDAGGGEPMRLVERFTGVQRPRPAFTPDGGAIVFDKVDDPSQEFAGAYGTYSVNLKTRETTRLPIPIVASPSQLQYSRDGSRITYVLTEEGSHPALYVADASFSNARKLVELNANDDVAPSFSPDGRPIAYTDAVSKFGSGKAIFVVSADGSDRRQVSKPGDEEIQTAPSWGLITS
jgi:Tol biopolymer transport system component